MRRVLLIVPIVLICLILYIYKHQNSDKETQRIENDIALLRSAINPQAQSLLDKRMREINSKSDREKVNVMEDIIPSKADLDGVLDTISSDAKRSKVAVNSLKVVAEESIVSTKDDVVKRISISVDVLGSFNSIENFLERVSASERFISVENVSTKKEGGMLRALIIFSVYYLQEK